MSRSTKKQTKQKNGYQELQAHDDPPRARYNYKNVNKEYLVALIIKRKAIALKEKGFMEEEHNKDHWEGRVFAYNDILKILGETD